MPIAKTKWVSDLALSKSSHSRTSLIIKVCTLSRHHNSSMMFPRYHTVKWKTNWILRPNIKTVANPRMPKSNTLHTILQPREFQEVTRIRNRFLLLTFNPLRTPNTHQNSPNKATCSIWVDTSHLRMTTVSAMLPEIQPTQASIRKPDKCRITRNTKNTLVSLPTTPTRTIITTKGMAIEAQLKSSSRQSVTTESMLPASSKSLKTTLKEHSTQLNHRSRKATKAKPQMLPNKAWPWISRASLDSINQYTKRSLITRSKGLTRFMSQKITFRKSMNTVAKRSRSTRYTIWSQATTQDLKKHTKTTHKPTTRPMSSRTTAETSIRITIPPSGRRRMTGPPIPWLPQTRLSKQLHKSPRSTRKPIPRRNHRSLLDHTLWAISNRASSISQIISQCSTRPKLNTPGLRPTTKLNISSSSIQANTEPQTNHSTRITIIKTKRALQIRTKVGVL